MKRDTGLDTLLSMDGYKYVYPNLYWWKIKAYKLEPSKERPHGIRYTLTFHDNKGTRIFGMDNKHIPPNRRKGFHGRTVEYDHTHEDKNDKGTAYTFINAEKLMTEFFERIDKILAELEK